MDTLHTVLRAIRGETQPKSDHLKIFREFLAHLDRTRASPTPKRRASPKQTHRTVKTGRRTP